MKALFLGKLFLLLKVRLKSLLTLPYEDQSYLDTQKEIVHYKYTAVVLL